MRDLTLAYSNHVSSALTAILDARHQPTRTATATSLSIALACETIATALSDVAHLEVGADPRPLCDLAPDQARRFRRLAEQAIESLDVHRYDNSIEHAIAETLIWLEGSMRGGHAVTTEEIIREALHRMLAHAQTPKVTR